MYSPRFRLAMCILLLGCTAPPDSPLGSNQQSLTKEVVREHWVRSPGLPPVNGWTEVTFADAEDPASPIFITGGRRVIRIDDSGTETEIAELNMPLNREGDPPHYRFPNVSMLPGGQQAFATMGRDLYFTDDVGRSWQRVAPPTQGSLVAAPQVGAFDRNNLFTIGRSPGFKMSHDGGRSWYEPTVRGEGAEAGSRTCESRHVLPDVGYAWFVCERGVYRTVDRGATWEFVSGTSAHDIMRGSIHFADEQHGWITQGTKILYSTSGGVSSAPTGAVPLDWEVQFDAGIPLVGVSVGRVGASTPAHSGYQGWAVGHQGTVLFASDALAGNWQLVDAPLSTRNDLSDVATNASGSRVVIVGSNGQIFESTDRGASWSDLQRSPVPTASGSLPTIEDFDVHSDGEHAYAVAGIVTDRARPVHQILSTSDGGRSWQAVGLSVVWGDTRAFRANLRAVAIDPEDPLHVCVGGEVEPTNGVDGERILACSNNGRSSWAVRTYPAAEVGPGSVGFERLRFGPPEEGSTQPVLFASSGRRLRRLLSDDGLRWNLEANVELADRIVDIDPTPHGAVWVTAGRRVAMFHRDWNGGAWGREVIHHDFPTPVIDIWVPSHGLYPEWALTESVIYSNDTNRGWSSVETPTTGSSCDRGVCKCTFFSFDFDDDSNIGYVSTHCGFGDFGDSTQALRFDGFEWEFMRILDPALPSTGGGLQGMRIRGGRAWGRVPGTFGLVHTLLAYETPGDCPSGECPMGSLNPETCTCEEAF